MTVQYAGIQNSQVKAYTSKNKMNIGTCIHYWATAVMWLQLWQCITLELNLQMNIILLWVSHGKYSNDSAEQFVVGKYSSV